jgi:molecular chaperone DnaK
MPYVLGIDIGTISTVAATARPDGDPAPRLLALGTRGAAVPSVLYLDEAGQALVGEAAERRVVSHPERVVREVKRRVGDTVPVSVGDVTVTPEDLYAAQARWVLDRAEEREGEPPAAVAVAVPATWGSYRAGIVRDALAEAGLPDVTLVSEPRAAARHYLAQPRMADGATVAVFDFGGGTFDAAVVRRSGPDGCEILGRPEGLERLGGADLDELVLAHVAAAVGDHLRDLSPQAPGALAALARLRRECTEAKEALSADAETTVPVLLPGLQTQVRIVRAELEELITPAVEETLDALAAALDTAKVAPEDLEAILLVGGSSRIPLVAELLSARFGRPVAVDTDPQASVALGAAREAAESLAVATEAAVAPAAAAPARALAAAGASPRGWTVAAGTISGTTALGDAAGGTTAETPDEAPARLVAAGGSFVPRQVPARRRHVTGVRVLAVSAAVLGITVVTSMAGQTPAVIEAGRSTLSSVVAKLGDSVQPDAPAAAAAEAGRSGGGGVPMATDASVFAGRRAQGRAIATTSPQASRSTDGQTSSDTRTPAVVEAPGRGTTAPSPSVTPGGGAGTGTKAPSSPSPTSPGTGTPGTGTPGTPTPTTDPTTPPPTQEPTTPPPTQEPTTPPPTQEPTTPPPTQEPTTPPPTTPPATQQPTEPPTTDPTTPPTTEPTTPAATPTAVPSETSGTTDPVSPSPSAGGG